MKVLIDVFNNNEMLSDSWPWKYIYEDTTVEVQGKMVTKGALDIGIESEEGVDDKGETVIDIVDSMRLKETQFDKKSFTVYVKTYLKRVKAYLEENGKAERVPNFQKGATELIKFVLAKFDEIQFFCGEDYDLDGAVSFAIFKDSKDPGPTFYFLVDGLKEVKY